MGNTRVKRTTQNNPFKERKEERKEEGSCIINKITLYTFYFQLPPKRDLILTDRQIIQELRRLIRERIEGILP